MKSNSGLTLWLVGIQLLVILKIGFVSGQCTLPSGGFIQINENFPKDEVVYNLTTDNWTFKSATPSGYIQLTKDGFGYSYLKAVKIIDVEEMQKKEIKVILNCNGDKTITIVVPDRNEFPPMFSNSSYTESVKEDASLNTVVFKAADYVTDKDFSSIFKFSAMPANTSQEPPDGVASGFFSVTSDGQVLVVKALDFEIQNQYSIDILVKDQNLTAQTKLVINLEDIDDKPPTFFVSNASIPVNSPAIYFTVISIYDMGEITVSNGPILAKDTESDKYQVEYSILPGTLSDYFGIDKSSGKVSVIKKLPENAATPTVISIRAEDVSPKKLNKIASLIVTFNKVKTDPTTTEMNPTTEITTTNNPSSMNPSTLASTNSAPVTTGQTQSSTDSLTSTSPTGPSSSSSSSSSVTLGENQTTTDPSQSTPPTGFTPSSSVDSSSLTTGRNQNTTDSLTSISRTGLTSSSSQASSVTSGQKETTTDASQSTSPTGTSLPLSQPSVTTGKDQSTHSSSNSILLSSQNTMVVTNDGGLATTANASNISIPVVTPETEAFTNEEYFGTVGAFLIIIVLIIAIFLFCIWKRKRDAEKNDSEEDLVGPKPLGFTEYDNISQPSLKMNGVENNAADLAENGQMPKEDYGSVSNMEPLTSSFVEKIENENVYTNLDIPENVNDSVPEIPADTLGDGPPIDTVVYDKMEDIPIPITHFSAPPLLHDEINDNADVASQQSSEAPVPMTFADLGKKNSVSFADDRNLLQHDEDGESNNQPDGLSYVDHINNDNDDDDDNHANSANKPEEKPSDEEMTWLVADNDGNQQDQNNTDQQENEASPVEPQRQLSHNNEIGYAPLLDDSHRDSWGMPDNESIRL